MDYIDNDVSHEDPFDQKDLDRLTKKQARTLAITQSIQSEPPCCPECHKTIDDRTESKCSYCGFSYGYLQKLFPTDLPVLDSVNDFSKQLNQREIHALELLISKIKKKYPQLFVKLVTLPLQPDIEIQQMALWMLNQCPLPAGQKDSDRLWTILLMIDTTRKNSCYANGYKIEVFWTHATCTDSITHLNRALRNTPLFEVLEVALKGMLLNLDYSKRIIKRVVKKQSRKFNRRNS